MNKMNSQLSILLLILLVMGCQPNPRNAHKDDQIYKFLEGEVATLTAAIADLDKEVAELDKPSPDDETSLLTMKVAAHRRTMFQMAKERAKLVQERTYLQMKLRSRAHSVIFRTMKGEVVDGAKEFAVFEGRYQPRILASE